MQLYVARHTQTNYNVADLCNADPSVDVHLTELGRTQATTLAAKLHGITFDIIYVTELPRTTQTAQFLEQTQKLSPTIDARLNENRSGFEGQSSQAYNAALQQAADSWQAVFNDGESMAAVHARVANFLQDLQPKPYDNVLIITHGTIVSMIRSIMTGNPFSIFDTFDVAQGSYELFELGT